MNRQTAKVVRKVGVWFGAAILFSIVLTGNASASAPGFTTYAGCGQTAKTRPSHSCQIGEKPGVFFKSSTDTTYDVCLTTPVNTTCSQENQALAGTLYVNRTLVFVPGRYFVTWTVGEEAQVVGSWTYTISKTYWETCEGSSFPGVLRVHRIACQVGHEIIKRFAEKAQTQGPHITVNGFHCNARAGISPINCYRGKQRVSYSGGF